MIGSARLTGSADAMRRLQKCYDIATDGRFVRRLVGLSPMSAFDPKRTFERWLFRPAI